MHPKNQLRWRIAQAAARIMAAEGIHDHALAKRKAAARMGVTAISNLPRNEEIDAALDEHHRLYRSETQPRHIRRLRQLALEAMAFLRLYSPRLVGAVLEGWAGEFSPITLHLFPDNREDVLMSLSEAGIPFKEKTLGVNLGAGRTGQHAAICFEADGVEIRLFVWPENGRERAAIRNHPSAGLKALESLLEEG